MNPEKGEILIFNKPYRWTSFNVVAKVRRELSGRLGVKKLKVGHAGTLDPLATGVLIVCTGKATKRIDELQAHTKEYVATIKLGATTPSFDMETEEDNTFPTEHITRELVEEKIQNFVGRIEQIPPAFSACKIDGKRAFKLARQGEEVELKPKVLVIDEIELLNFGMVENSEDVQADDRASDDPRDQRIKYQTGNITSEHLSMTIRVVCSKGTYIRALARDIGQALGSGGYLTDLIRTRIGEYSLRDCIDIEHLEEWLDKQTFEKE
ncbi:MAG: tRNA pseudouridine(55) synthase TruB [Bacteroidaceae bacterium]|nr:tRNA pseudouridine(55) synthase TruB [Bacteroidaceae bacterium]